MALGTWNGISIWLQALSGYCKPQSTQNVRNLLEKKTWNKLIKIPHNRDCASSSKLETSLEILRFFTFSPFIQRLSFSHPISPTAPKLIASAAQTELRSHVLGTGNVQEAIGELTAGTSTLLLDAFDQFLFSTKHFFKCNV